MSKKIVWIEDDIDVIYPLVRPLERAGYQITTFTNALDALNKIEELRQADLILLDLLFSPGFEGPNLGEYPGLGFLHKLRKEFQITVPVIVLSVIRREDILEKLRAFNDVHIIHKPVLPSYLKEQVERALSTTD